MINHIIKSVCINCGVDCSYYDSLCEKCVSELIILDNKCNNCGRALKFSNSLCSFCNYRHLVDKFYSDYAYSGAIKFFIKSIKFNWMLRGADQLGRLAICENLDFTKFDFGVCVPYHFFRRFRRFKQPVDIISKELRTRGLVFNNKLLVRTINTPYQSRLSSTMRKVNVRGVFTPISQQRIAGKNILLVDDIMTTGATVIECCKALKGAGASRISVYTLISGV